MRAEPHPQPPKRRILKRAVSVVFGVLLALFLAGAFLLATGFSAPDWARQRLETRLNQGFSGGAIAIGNIRFSMLQGTHPSVSLEQVNIFGEKGQLRAVVPEIRTELTALDFLTAKFRPVSITLTGARLQMRRDQDGRFDISVGSGDSGGFLKGDNISEVLDEVEQIFEAPMLERLQVVQTVQSSVTLDDAFSNRTWLVKDTDISFENTPTEMSGNITFKLENQGAEPAAATFSMRKKRGETRSEISARFNGFRTEDMADQIVAFDWLRLLNAPISGSVSLDILGDGSFGKMNGVLDIGAGSLRQTAQGKPARFSGAKAYLSYDQSLEKISFDQITIDTEAAHLVAEGHAYVSGRTNRNIEAVIAQLKFSEIVINPEGVFEKPIEFDFGALDMRVHLSPLKIDIGQMVLVDDETRYLATGSLSAGATGWTSAVDLTVKSLSRNRALALWPQTFKNKTRTWLKTNIFAGNLHNVSGFLRGTPGEKPKLTLGFDVADLSMRFMRTMPPIENGSGYGVLSDNKMNMVLQQGTLTAPDSGEVNLAGSSIVIPDVRIKNAPADIDLKTHSSVPSLLSILDLKPFHFISKSGVGTDVAEGAVSTDGRISLPLSNKVTFDQVDFRIEGELKGPSSAKLVKGKTLSAERLKAFTDNTGLTISGDGFVGDLPISGLWRQDFGPEHKGKSRIEGQIELSQKFLDEFGIALPKGSVQGRGTGDIRIDLVSGKPPEFRLRSDLNKVGLSLDVLGWHKPKNVTGRLDVKGQFGAPPKINSISIQTRGLKAKGSVKLNSDSTLDVARFHEVDIGGWLKAPLEIRTGKNGNAAFTLLGGQIDFRKSQFSTGSGDAGDGGSAAQNGNLITVNLDTLILSSGISLTDIQGDLNSANGVTGSFSGRVNGQARIVGAFAPLNGGTAVRFTSDEAGDVMRSAGVFSSAIGGRMDMVLVPAGQSGHYNGTLKIDNPRVKNASALADLLSAISVVGLLEQLGGEGIAFSDVAAKFKLNPAGVELQESSAVGASLGLTMQGAYSFTSQSMDMQGVITPIYMLNGILEQTKIFGGLFGKQKGEGLFGFNYTLKGSVDDPKVGVNPLSILTPGLFRELFRQPIPKAPE